MKGLSLVPNKRLEEDLKQILNVETCKPVGTPTTKAWSFQAGDQEILDEKACKLYRAAVGKLLFVAQDRADIKHATKECARDLAEPAGLSTRKVKRVVRYLAGTSITARVSRRTRELGAILTSTVTLFGQRARTRN